LKTLISVTVNFLDIIIWYLQPAIG